ncbi:MAG: hypothetical protein ACFFCZ_15145 [Promethearchaeota archaeon]
MTLDPKNEELELWDRILAMPIKAYLGVWYVLGGFLQFLYLLVVPNNGFLDVRTEILSSPLFFLYYCVISFFYYWAFVLLAVVGIFMIMISFLPPFFGSTTSELVEMMEVFLLPFFLSGFSTLILYLLTFDLHKRPQEQILQKPVFPVLPGRCDHQFAPQTNFCIYCGIKLPDIQE